MVTPVLVSSTKGRVNPSNNRFRENIMKKLIVAASLALSFGAFAEQVEGPVAPTAQVDPITTQFSGLGITVKQIKDSPLAGLKTVITDKGVLYSSADGKYLIQGTMIDS